MALFEIGSLKVFGYGLALALAVALGLLLFIRQCRQRNISGTTALQAFVWMLPMGVLGARAGYCLVSVHRMLQQEPGFFFRLWEGGFMLYGTLAGCAAGLAIAARRSRVLFPMLSDAAVPAGALVIALTRLAENLVGVGYGRHIADWFNPWMQQSSFSWSDPSVLYRFPFGMQEPHYGEWHFNIANLEALGAVLILIVLLRLRPRRAGGRTLLFLLLYAASQALFESMRMDAVLKWGMIRVSQLLSGITVLLVLMICLWRLRAGRAQAALHILCALLSAGVIIAMEFALEQKINFLTWMRMDVCYGVMILGCAGLFLSAWPVWKQAYPIEK